MLHVAACCAVGVRKLLERREGREIARGRRTRVGDGLARTAETGGGVGGGGW